MKPKEDKSSQLRQVPSIEKLMQAPSLAKWKDGLKHSIRVQLAQELTQSLRQSIQKGKPCPSFDELCDQLGKRYDDLFRRRKRHVINATGIILHTNLGRAPLGKKSLENLTQALASYSTLEYDPIKGDRGGRTTLIERLLCLLCEVPAAMVVNNNAASLFLILHRLLKENASVVISRGELVQIGGGFRIPDILRASGAPLYEVGTTNITQLKDYEEALSDPKANCGMLLKVHQSNFYMEGHSKEAGLSELVALSKKHNVPCVVDLGSGCLIDQTMDPHERTVKEVVRSGADLVCFSGDKLLGGPQAGIIIGSKDSIEALKQSPMYRAFRLGKTEIFLMEETLLLYAQNQLPPVWQFLLADTKAIEARCEALKQALGKQKRDCEIVEGKSPIGGGAMPSTELSTPLLELKVTQPERFLKTLRLGTPSVLLRTENKRVFLDLRTVFEDEVPALEARLQEAWV